MKAQTEIMKTKVGQLFATALVAALVSGVTAPARAAINYVTSFEAPTFTAGATVVGVEG